MVTIFISVIYASSHKTLFIYFKIRKRHVTYAVCVTKQLYFTRMINNYLQKQQMKNLIAPFCYMLRISKRGSKYNFLNKHL